MSIQWVDFLADARPGNVAGTFEFFDTEAQIMVIRDTDDALISTYDAVELGQWKDCIWSNNLRIGHFGLSQFVPRHPCNGEIWAVGITPNAVAPETGMFPTPGIESGFFIYRYKYFQDLTNILDSFDTSEQSENPIKDAGFTIKNISEEELNKTSSIFASGSKIISKIGMGDSSKTHLATVFVDEVSWDKTGETMTLSGRNAIGYYLSEQSFDEVFTFSGTRASVVNDMLLRAGVDMTKVFIEKDVTVSNPKFEPTDKILDGLNEILNVWGWRITELPDNRIIIGSSTFHDTFYKVGLLQFLKDEAFTRGITQRSDGAYSRIALQSNISATDTTPQFTRTVYKYLPYFEGWNIGNHRTLYLPVLADMSETDMNTMITEYAKAYPYIGVNISREIPIRPEVQSGDVIDFIDADSDEYIQQGIITSVGHKVDVKNGTAKTVLSIDSGGTIEIGTAIKTYTAANVTGDTRKREFLDVIRKAAKEAAEKKAAKEKKSSTNTIDGGEL